MGSTPVALDIDRLAKKWRIDTGGMLNSTFRVVPGDTCLVVSAGERCRSISLVDGRELWSRDSVATFPFVAADGQLMIRDDGKLQSIEMRSGNINWTADKQIDVVANGTINENRLLLPTSDAIEAIRMHDRANVAT